MQQLESNHMGGFDKHYYAYTFTGKVLKHLHIHNVQGGVSRQEVYTYNYDHAERLTKVTHNQDSNPAVVLTENTYDEYCRLSQKKLHSGIDNLTYAYNTRGWLTGITSQKFNQKLYFTDGKGTPCYNGNISSMTWKTTNDAAERGYKFTYDGLSRLKDAIYGEGATLGNNPNSFNEQVTGYDKQGNILGLKRYGQTSATVCGLIDNLTMTYNGNQLKKVTDSAVSPVYGSGFDFKDGANQVTEYTYDANGNLTKDLNKKIAGIQYNCLNLPSRIAFEDGSTISYTYAMNGVKLRTVHVIAGVTTTTDYCGNVIYENGSAKTLLNEAGYISLNDNKYHYYIQDHQGNNRLVLNQNGTVEEVNHFYPFGGLLGNTTTVQPHKYNGKELDRKKGLDWYDYGARHYDAAIGRFSTVDPMTEKYYNANLYGYCANNPIKFIDPTGMVYRGYTVDEKGFIIPINEEGGDEYDVLYNLKKYSLKTSKNYDKSGKKAGIKISKGILSGTKEKNMSSKQVKGAGVTLDGHSTGNIVLNHAYEVQSDEESLSIMDFLDRNTDVEWSNTLMENGQGRRVNLLDTSHEEGTVRLETHQLNKYTRVGFKVMRADHIHPKPGDITPSGKDGDLGNAKVIQKESPQATFRILNNGKYYIYMKPIGK